MRIKYLTQDSLALCRANMADIVEECVVNKRCTVPELLKDGLIIQEMPLEMEKITLDMNADAGYLTDAKNAQIVYEAMKGLSDSQASDERLWAAYALVENIDYVIWRWAPKTVDQFKQHAVYGFGPHRSLFRNAMSRLWWLGRVTRDDRRANPYELTEFTCQHTDIIQFICEQPVFQKPCLMKGVISAMYDLDRSEIKIEKSIIQDLGKYMNLLSGTYLLDQFDQSKIYEMAQKHIRKFVEKKGQ